MAVNIVLMKTNGTQQLQDIATIGKLVYVGDDLQLLSHDGEVLAQESVLAIRKICFEHHSTPTHPVHNTANEIIIYPNPTQDILLIKGVETQTLRIFDLQGRLLKTSSGQEIGVEDLAEGTYLLQVGTSIVRFIKQ